MEFGGKRGSLGGDSHDVPLPAGQDEDVTRVQVYLLAGYLRCAVAFEQHVERHVPGCRRRVVEDVAAREKAAKVDGAVQTRHAEECADGIHEPTSMIFERFSTCQIKYRCWSLGT
jgi:hypothetical protein